MVAWRYQDLRKSKLWTVGFDEIIGKYVHKGTKGIYFMYH